MPTTPDGQFELIDCDYPEVIPPLQEFQRQVESLFAAEVSRLATLASGVVVVTLPETQPDTNYDIYFAPKVGEYFWATSQTTSQFTLNSSNGASSASVGWFLRRRAPAIVTGVIVGADDVQVLGVGVTVTI